MQVGLWVMNNSEPSQGDECGLKSRTRIILIILDLSTLPGFLSLGFDLPGLRWRKQRMADIPYRRVQVDTEEGQKESMLYLRREQPRRKRSTDKVQGYSRTRTSTRILSANGETWQWWRPRSHGTHRSDKLLLHPKEKCWGRERD